MPCHSLMHARIAASKARLIMAATQQQMAMGHGPPSCVLSRCSCATRASNAESESKSHQSQVTLKLQQIQENTKEHGRGMAFHEGKRQPWRDPQFQGGAHTARAVTVAAGPQHSPGPWPFPFGQRE
uniref:Uncharacterized protein n=1 Tax=Setaria italica TaxID=4555 RepID=K3YAU5_SETIT